MISLIGLMDIRLERSSKPYYPLFCDEMPGNIPACHGLPGKPGRQTRVVWARFWFIVGTGLKK
jgi:hypothetical protein